jgi:tetratricopeptide (TPR) repeat protein
LKDFERAIQLNPGYGPAHQHYAACLTVFRRHDEAIAEAKRARELDPFSPIINSNVGRRLYFARKYDQAIEESLKALNITPDFFPSLWNLGLTYLQKGMFSEAILEMQKAVRYSEDNLFIKAHLGYVYGATGNQAKAQVILNGLIETSKEGYVPSIVFANIYIGLGDNDNAISWLEKAYEEHSPLLGGPFVHLNTNPIYDPLRSDPRFIELIKKMGFE